MKVAGIVVCNPDYGRLKENVKAIYPQVEMVVVYLNSDFDRGQMEGFDRVHYLNNGENKGIATALNSIMEYAESLGAEWCLLLDQDTVVPDDCIELYEKHISLEKAAVLSPHIRDDRDMEKIDFSTADFSIIDMCITSGSYNNIAIWNKVKRYREEFFIDYVDWEYCARVRSSGYKIYRINTIIVNHQLGAKTYHKFLGKNVFTYNHNAFRKYYITRNTIVAYKLFPGEPKLAHPYLRTWKRMLFTVLFEEGKSKKIEAIIRGYIDSCKLYRELRRKQKYGY